MGKLVVTEFLSADGVMENPAWTAPYWNDQIAAFKLSELMASDVLLLGRVTYEGFAEAWPTQKDEQGFADKMNSMSKYVVSTTLDKAEWTNSHLIKSNAADEIKKLKQTIKGDILVGGSATLIQMLIKENLVDQYNILVYPVVLGNKGIRLFQEGAKATLTLVEAKPFNAVTALVYHPAKS